MKKMINEYESLFESFGRSDQNNICYLISSGGLFGAEKVMLNLAKMFNYNGMKSWITVIENAHNPHLELIDMAKKENVPAFSIKSQGRFDFSAVDRLCDFIKKKHIGIMHTHNYKANFIGFLAAKKSRIPIVATLHGYTEDDWKIRLYSRFDRFILRFFDKVILVDDSLKKWFKNGSVRYEVINNGVDTISSGHQVTRSQVRLSLGIKEDELVIGTVGRLSQEKGHKYLIEAFAKIIRDFTNVRLVIIGDGELKKDLEDLSLALGIQDKVIFTGFQEDVSKYYQNMDIYVSSSLIEHFPMVVLEAMSFSKAIVATNVGGTARLISDGEQGLIVEPASTEQLYQGIRRVLCDSNLREKLGVQAQKRVKEYFSLQKMLDAYRKIYDEVMEV